jgi:hypothetical protein
VFKYKILYCGESNILVCGNIFIVMFLVIRRIEDMDNRRMIDGILIVRFGVIEIKYANITSIPLT